MPQRPPPRRRHWPPAARRSRRAAKPAWPAADPLIERKMGCPVARPGTLFHGPGRSSGEVATDRLAFVLDRLGLGRLVGKRRRHVVGLDRRLVTLLRRSSGVALAVHRALLR